MKDIKGLFAQIAQWDTQELEALTNALYVQALKIMWVDS